MNANGQRSVLGGLATMTASAASNQVGAAIGAHAFSSIGPAGVVAVRQFVAAAVLLPVARPDPRRFTWAQWWPALLLGLVFATMNLSLYTAIDRIGLGLAVTLEFLGPLAVALAGSRTKLDLLCALGASAGVYVLVLPGPTSDYLGVGLGLLAAACWASYILLNRLLGRRLAGLQGPATATAVAALLNLPVVVVLTASGRMSGTGIGYAMVAGLLSSVVPYAADLIALRRVPARLFGVVMSVHPVLAALAGLAILGQVLAVHEWVGIGIVVSTNALTVATVQRLRGAEVRRPLSPGERARGERLGGLLREARGPRSMVEVAAASRVPVETLRKIEAGRVPTPAFFTVAALAATVGLPLDHLVRACSHPHPPRGRGGLREGTGPVRTRCT